MWCKYRRDGERFIRALYNGRLWVTPCAWNCEEAGHFDHFVGYGLAPLNAGLLANTALAASN